MAEKDYSNYTVLVVDDIPLNVLLIRKMLMKVGVQIEAASNGKETLEKIAEKKPDLVLLDLMMPIMDGFQTLDAMQADPNMKDIKVVVLSALNNEPEVRRAMDAGAVDFITKPVIMTRLIECVEKYCCES